MKPVYYVLSADGVTQLTADVRPAVQNDFLKTEQENWQTSWLTDFIQDEALEKYAMEIAGTGEHTLRVHRAAILSLAGAASTWGSGLHCWRSAFSFPLTMVMAVQFT